MCSSYFSKPGESIKSWQRVKLTPSGANIDRRRPAPTNHSTEAEACERTLASAGSNDGTNGSEKMLLSGSGFYFQGLVSARWTTKQKILRDGRRRSVFTPPPLFIFFLFTARWSWRLPPLILSTVSFRGWDGSIPFPLIYFLPITTSGLSMTFFLLFFYFSPSMKQRQSSFAFFNPQTNETFQRELDNPKMTTADWSLFEPQRKQRETKVRGRDGVERRKRKKKLLRLPIQRRFLGKTVNNAARRTARRLCGAVAMATPSF